MKGKKKGKKKHGKNGMFPRGLILDISASLTMTSATIRDTAKTDLRSVLVSNPDALHMRDFLLAI